MAKIYDKLYNRIIEGKLLELTQEDLYDSGLKLDIEDLILNDKEVVKNIVVFENPLNHKATLIFPKNVFPLCWYQGYDGNYVYFDYDNNKLLADDGTAVVGANIVVNDNQVSVNMGQPYEIDGDGLSYCHFDINPAPINTYNLFRTELPEVSGDDDGKVLLVSDGTWQAGNISGGTKLYKHEITFVDGAETIHLTLVTASSESLKNGKLNDVIKSFFILLDGYSETTTNSRFFHIMYVPTTYVIKNLSGFSISAGTPVKYTLEVQTNISISDDTVTPL